MEKAPSNYSYNQLNTIMTVYKLLIEKTIFDQNDLKFQAYLKAKSNIEIRIDTIGISLFIMALWTNQQKSQSARPVDFETQFIPAIFTSLIWQTDRAIFDEKTTIDTILKNHLNQAKH